MKIQKEKIENLENEISQKQKELLDLKNNKDESNLETFSEELVDKIINEF